MKIITEVYSQQVKYFQKCFETGNLSTFVTGLFLPLTFWRLTAFGMALRGNFSGSVSATDLVEASKDAASLLVCTRKKFFWLGKRIFCELHHQWRTFRPPWPTLPGPGPKPLDGSISLKFLSETRLQSEFFNTFDDLLGFWVQKL